MFGKTSINNKNIYRNIKIIELLAILIEFLYLATF
jgi:hypothetical protein